MGFTLTTPPETEPVSVLEATRHLRLDMSNVQPRPTAPTATLVTSAGNVNAGTHRYCVTFVTESGETDGGDVSGIVTTVAGVEDDVETTEEDETVPAAQQVALTNIAVGGAGVIARNIYRTKAGGASYFLLATLDNNTATTYTDNTDDASLGPLVPSSNSTVDPELTAMIAAARHQAERYTGAGFIAQGWTMTVDAFPTNGVIQLPRGPVLSIDEVIYLGSDGSEQELDEDSYVLDQGTLSATLSLASGVSRPTTATQRGAVTIAFTVGYGETAEDVPADIKAAILLRVGDLYRNREARVSGSLQENDTVRALLDPHVRAALA